MAGKKAGLGRGLDALFPEKTVQSKPKTVKTVKEEKKVEVDTKKSSQQETSNGERMMKISMIEPNREQPRKKFDEDAVIIIDSRMQCMTYSSVHLCNPAGGYIRWEIESHH